MLFFGGLFLIWITFVYYLGSCVSSERPPLIPAVTFCVDFFRS